jgi:hypothetical protein
MTVIELLDDGAYVTETCSIWKYIFVASTVFLLIIYTFVTHNRIHIMMIQEMLIKYVVFGVKPKRSCSLYLKVSRYSKM